MRPRKLSFRRRAVKAHTLQFAPKGWFSVQDYLAYLVEDIDMRFAGEGKLRVLELAEGRLPSEKALSMRLCRYTRQGLLKRRREGHKFLYAMTYKGKLRGPLLKKYRESIYERLPGLRPRARPAKPSGRGKHTVEYTWVSGATPARHTRGKFHVENMYNVESHDLEQVMVDSVKEKLKEKRKCMHCGAILLASKDVCPECHRIA